MKLGLVLKELVIGGIVFSALEFFVPTTDASPTPAVAVVATQTPLKCNLRDLWTRQPKIGWPSKLQPIVTALNEGQIEHAEKKMTQLLRELKRPSRVAGALQAERGEIEFIAAMVEEHASGKNIVDHLKTGYSISPANSSLLTALACRTINEESATVTKLLEEAIWFDRFNSPGTRAFAQLLLAQHYERLGMYAKAKTVLQRLQNDPDVALAGQARMALARSLIGAGERQAAIALLRRSAKVTPTLEERLLLVEALLADPQHTSLTEAKESFELLNPLFTEGADGISVLADDQQRTAYRLYITALLRQHDATRAANELAAARTRFPNESSFDQLTRQLAIEREASAVEAGVDAVNAPDSLADRPK